MKTNSSTFLGAWVSSPRLLPAGQKHNLSLWLIQSFALSILMAIAAKAQIQQAWVSHYNNGILNGTNQSVKMALDSNGNIYITGFSQNANSQLGYITIKYARNGNQLWADRYDSTGSPMATPAAMVLDVSNDAIVTGSDLTVKYDPNGNQLWTAPYAGTALACDGSGEIYVVGFGTNFNTVKLAPAGTNLWLTTYSDVGPTVSQSVLVDSGNNVYVSGLDTYYTYHGFAGGPNVQLTTIKYGPNGNQLWMTIQAAPGPSDSMEVAGAALDGANNFYLVSNWQYGENYVTFKYATNGNLIWSAYPDNTHGFANGLALDDNTNVLLVGQDTYQYTGVYSYDYTTFKLNFVGSKLWSAHYPQPPYGSSAATSIAVDSVGNSYITGYSPGTNSFNDIVTIAYGPNGNQLWLQRYHGLGSGNCAGNAIAVDNNGNVYVTGYDTTAAGGTEIVTIKYSPVSLQRRADGTVLLEAQGSPGESFDIQASADLQSWVDLGSAITDTNGLMQFDDTNAPNYPARFYVTFPQ